MSDESRTEIVVANNNGAHNRLPAELQVNAAGGLVVVECTLTGITPMLQNALSRQTLGELWNPTSRPSKTAARPDPREYADGRIHRLEDGRPCVPNPMLYSAFKAAGVYIRLEGRKMVTTTKGSHLPSMMTLLTTEIPINLPGTDTPAPWEVDMQRGVNPNAGGGVAVCIVRPRFDRWELKVELEIDQKETSIERMRELVEKAGRRAGLGDFRPGRKGIYGQFAITNWAVKHEVM